MTNGAVCRVAVAGIAAVSLIAGSGACGDDPLGPESRALAGARARWEASGITAYTYEYRMSCFCPPQLLETALVSVAGGQVTAAFLVESARQAPPETLSWYYTVDGLFDRLESDLEREPAVFEVTYDESIGFPTSANVDVSTRIADEEYGFTASGLVAVVP